jgi:hypothetical protein
MESKVKLSHILNVAAIIIGAAMLSVALFSSVKYFKSFDRVIGIEMNLRPN